MSKEKELKLRIDINEDYCITASNMQFILNKKLVGKDGVNKGKEVLKQYKFFWKLAHLLEYLLNQSLRESEAKDILALLSDLKRVEEQIYQAADKITPTRITEFMVASHAGD